MNEQALELDPPNEIHFKGPYTDVTTTFLFITNPTPTTICFKIKTTAPKAYCVRPNGGILAPGKSAKIVLMLQPLSDPESEDRNKDKFMVQSAFTPGIDTWSDTVWQNMPPSEFMNSKLKCVFDFAMRSIDTAATTSDTSDHHNSERDQPTEEDHPGDNKIIEFDSKVQDLKKENIKLNAELHSLRQENSSLKEEGLRSRMARPQKPSSTEPTHVIRHPPTLQAKFKITPTLIALVVVALALGVFVGKAVL